MTIKLVVETTQFKKYGQVNFAHFHHFRGENKKIFETTIQMTLENPKMFVAHLTSPEPRGIACGAARDSSRPPAPPSPRSRRSNLRFAQTANTKLSQKGSR